MGIFAAGLEARGAPNSWVAPLVAQEGKLDVMVLTAAMMCPIAAAIAHYTGSKVLILTWSSGRRRLAIGLLSVLYVFGVSLLG
jgi:hypothetical protein